MAQAVDRACSMYQDFTDSPMLEMLSGTASLTKAFEAAGWTCAPPMDIVFDSFLNLMDPGFVCIALCFSLEKRFRLIHLAPLVLPFPWP